MEVAHPSARLARGITLMELITTLAVAGVSLALVVPSWTGLANRSQAIAAANQLLAHLNYARNAAASRRQMVTLCPSVDGTSCSGDPLGWQNGYLVFEDRDGNRRRAPGEPLLRVQGGHGAALRLQTSAGRPAVRFRPDGAAWSTNTTFRVCLDDDGANRAIVLYGTGRARVDRRLPDGGPVTCR